MKSLPRSVIAGILFSPIISLATSSAPDAGQILQQIKPQIQRIEPKKPILVPDEDDDIKPKDVSEGEVDFFVKEIILTGNKLITTEEIYLLFASLVNRNITIDELKTQIHFEKFIRKMRIIK